MRDVVALAAMLAVVAGNMLVAWGLYVAGDLVVTWGSFLAFGGVVAAAMGLIIKP